MVDFFLTYIVPGSVLFPIIMYILNRRAATKPLSVLFMYLIMAAIVDIAASIMASLGIHNLWLLHLYTVLETVILLFFFLQIIHARKARKIIWVLLIIFPLACICNALFLQKPAVFNTYTRSIEAVLIIAVSSYYWLNNSKENQQIAWTNNPLNWIISGLLLYFASALFLFLFSNYVTLLRRAKPSDRVYDIIWVSHGMLVIIMYLFFGIGFNKSKHVR